MMNRLLFLLVLFLPLMASAQDTTEQESPTRGEYVLAPGDSIQVRVYGEDDLSMKLAVPVSGGVEYAFVGRLELAGKTVADLREEIYQLLLGDYLVKPRVSVTVAKYRDFYVYGEVRRPGSYAWEPGMTILKVIILAGGLKERASGSKWYLVPEGGTENDRIKVNGHYALRPGDTLTIEQSFF